MGWLLKCSEAGCHEGFDVLDALPDLVLWRNKKERRIKRRLVVRFSNMEDLFIWHHKSVVMRNVI